MKHYLPIINVIAYVVTLVINFLSQAGKELTGDLFPYTVQELAELRAVLFLPANYVFGIWGLIYTALGAYIIYQATNREHPIIEKIGWWFVVSSVANSIWLVLFLNDWVGASTVAMLVLLGALITIYLRLGIGKTPTTRGEYWAVRFGFSVYLGWISVATVANIATALYQVGAETAFLGITSDLWTVLVMLVAAILATTMLVRHGDIAYAGVVIWAIVGIYARPFTTEVYTRVANQNLSLVNNGALVIAGVILIAIVAWLTLNRQQQTA